VRIVLDADRCTGHGRCYALAPDVFDADDDGHCIVRVEGDVPSELADKARTAVANCPELALSISDDA
jgi:ferredoxin